MATRRKPLGGGKTIQVKSTGKEARLARCIPMFAAGVPHAQIAAITGLGVRTVNRYATLPEVQECLQAASEKAQKGVAEVMASAREIAIGTLLDVMNDDGATPDARVKAALGLLDRTGHGPTVKQEHTGKDGGPIQHAVRPMTVDEARERAAQLQARLAERGITTTLLPKSEN